MRRLFDGAIEPSGQSVIWGIGHLAGRDDHVVHPWSQFDTVRRRAKSPLDAVARNCLPATPRDDEPESRGSVRPWRTDEDDTALAPTLPVGQDSTKVSCVAERLIGKVSFSQNLAAGAAWSRGLTAILERRLGPLNKAFP
jgi:hypothetical protein